MPLVESAVNNILLDRLGERCPLTVFTGLPRDSPLVPVKRKVGDFVKIHSIEKIRLAQTFVVDKVASAMEDMRKDVQQRSSKKRQKAVESHKRKTNIRPIIFMTRDFVLRGVLARERGKKPSLRWRGPLSVVECLSVYVFRIEDLLSGKREDAHGRRLKLFSNSDFNVTEEMTEHLRYQEGELLHVERFDDIRSASGNVDLLVKWCRLHSDESDWVSLETLRDDVLVVVGKFLTDIENTRTLRQRRLVACL